MVRPGNAGCSTDFNHVSVNKLQTKAADVEGLNLQLCAARRFELPAMVIFHTANAWQEGPDIVKLAACCFDEVGTCSCVQKTFGDALAFKNSRARCEASHVPADLHADRLCIHTSGQLTSAFLALQFELDIGSSHFRTPEHMPRLNLLTFNLKTGEATRKRVSPVVGDFPQIPGTKLGAPGCMLQMPATAL